jgi:spore maturation protein CgeB
MRIFLAISASGNSSIPGSNTWLYNLYEPLIDLGHDVILFRIDLIKQKLNPRLKSPLKKEIFSSYLINEFISSNKKKKIDFFLSYFRDEDIDPEIITQIRLQNVPTANFSCNNTHQFYLTEKIAPYFDFNLHSEKEAKQKFLRIGANPIWFQMAANPKRYFPKQTKTEYDVTFIGANYAKRAHYISHLLLNQIDVHCFGPNWLVNKPFPRLKHYYKEAYRVSQIISALGQLNVDKRLKLSASISQYDFNTVLRKSFPNNLHYPVNDNELIFLYRASKINLGFLEVYGNDNDGSKPIFQHIHLREFEVPMSGGLYFTNYSDELAEFYIPEKEIVTFRNEHELLEKIKFYLANPYHAEKVRLAGYERAKQCHTYQLRFQELFNKLNLK